MVDFRRLQWYSTRSVNFLAACQRSGVSEERRLVDHSTLCGASEAAEALDAAQAQIDHLQEVYGGLEVPVAGGVLRGRLTLGVKRNPTLWRIEDGGYVFRVGSHSDAQCAITMDSSGRFGVSWGFDFWPLFDSVEHFVASSAAWNSCRGWFYSVVADTSPLKIVSELYGSALDETASGELAQWWFGDGFAVVAERFLNPKRSLFMQVHVLAESANRSEALREVVETSESGQSVSFVARHSEVVAG